MSELIKPYKQSHQELSQSPTKKLITFTKNCLPSKGTSKLPIDSKTLIVPLFKNNVPRGLHSMGMPKFNNTKRSAILYQ